MLWGLWHGGNVLYTKMGSKGQCNSEVVHQLWIKTPQSQAREVQCVLQQAIAQTRSSVATARAEFFATLGNKLRKITKVFEELDPINSRGVLCQL